MQGDFLISDKTFTKQCTTLNIYTDVTKELKKKEFDSLQKKMGKKRSRKPEDE